MTQGVVDLLELVEIDEQQCRQLLGIVPYRQQAADLVAEIDPVGKRGQFVVTRQMADPGFGVAPLGDVFKQHDGAAARHRLERPGQRPASGDVGIGGDDIPRLRILDFREDHPSARRRNRSAADAGGDDVARAGAALHQIVGQVHHFAEAVIHDGKPPVGGEHAQAVGHVVQGGVELAGQRRFPETRGQRLHKDGMKAEVDAFQADEEQHQQHGEAEVIESAMQRQRKRHRPARKQNMQMDDRRTAVISRRAARRIADRHGDAEHMRDGIIDCREWSTKHQGPSTAA